MELIKSQELYFLASLLWGILLFFLYDLLRIFRKFIPHAIIFLALEDLLFWLIGSLFVFQMIFERNNGILRVFFIFAFLFGMYVYHSLVKDHFVNVTVRFITFLFSPIAFVIKKVKRLVKYILKKAKKSLIIALPRRKRRDDADEQQEDVRK